VVFDRTTRQNVKTSKRLRFSDNSFTLLPEAAATLTFEAEEPIGGRQSFSNALRVYTINNKKPTMGVDIFH
jgi:hypothetical protein